VTRIAISRLHFPVTTLGPGQRVGIWFQGCSIRCPGCISVDTWPHDRGLTTVGEAMRALSPWMAGAEGITVSGGEPFDQETALAELLRAIRAATPASVLLYTGHPFDRVAPWLADHPGLIDALMTEPYDAAAPQERALRGSDNQVLHLLTPLGARELAVIERNRNAEDLRLDAMFDADGTVWFAGIPRRGDLARLRELLADAGHRISTTEGSP